MIKLQDFAKQQGCSDRNIQKHIKKYAAELEGLYQRRGAAGTWLTEDACEILRNKMKPPSADVYDESKDKEIASLKERVLELEGLIHQKDILYTELQSKMSLKENALLEAQNQLRLIEDQNEVKIKAAVQEAEDKLFTELTNKRLENERQLTEQFQEALNAEKTRKLTLKERLFGRKQ